MCRLPLAFAFNDRLRQVLGGEYEIVSLLGQGGFARVAPSTVTFFGAPGEPAGRESVSRVRGTLVVLIAGLALLIGLLFGQALLAPTRSP